MPRGTDIFLWHPDEFEPLPIAKEITAIMLDWGYERGSVIEQEKNQCFEKAVSGSFRMPGDAWNVSRQFTDISELAPVAGEMESFGMVFTSPTKRNVGFGWSAFSDVDKPLMPHHKMKWGGGFSGVDLALCWAIECTRPNNIHDRNYYSMEEVLTAYNLIKKIFLDAGFQFAAAHSEDQYFFFGEQQGAYVGYDRLMRLDRNGINRLILPYEESRRIEMKDLGFDPATQLPYTGILEYSHFETLKIQKPPYHVD